jgi:two-component system cell cycle sensor histidine kinase/response regulator CckA
MAERNPAGIDVLITDVLMPELAGPELAITLRNSRPDLGIIFVSGDTSADYSVVQGAAVLQKPFTIKMLSSKLREVLPV